MGNKKIVIGSDHAGFKIKSDVIEYLKSLEYESIDKGCYSSESVDYPHIAQLVCKEILSNATGSSSLKGILICGTGIGMSLSANRFKGIRAALCCDEFSAQMAREHNDANILILGARVLDYSLMTKMVDIFLNTDFEGDRHSRRVQMIDKLVDNNLMEEF